MTFPVLLKVGPWHVHPHAFFEVLAYFVAAATFFLLRRRHGDPLTSMDRLSVVAAVFVGALLGSRALAWFDNPEARARGLVALMDGKTLVGGLLGGWIATELEKRRVGIRRPTGDLYVFPLVVGIAIGRVGCLLSGLPDGTYGTATSLPWGIDFGDGITRHPTALYESLFVIAIGLALLPVWRRNVQGHTFKLFMVSYLAFRLLVDTIKPGVALAFGLTAIQWACVCGLLYYAQWYMRERSHA
jgi:phosphatidylglycerol---prolipoprotein diacylglyceryl transferase